MIRTLRLVLAAAAILCAGPAFADTTLSPTTLVQPLVGGSSNTWGATINSNYATINGWFATGPALLLSVGGTGATTAASARTNLGVAIGSNVEAWSANLDALAASSSVANLTALAGLTSAADRVGYFTGSGTAALATFTSAARTLNAAVDAASERTVLGLGTSATVNTGQTGAVLGLLNDDLTLSGTTTHSGKVVVGADLSLNFANAFLTVNPNAGSYAAQFMLDVNFAHSTIAIRNDRSDSGPFVFLHGASTTIGSVTTTATTTSFNTTSDYRLKTDVEPLRGALGRLSLLRPVRYHWKANMAAPKSDGFLAHEVSPAVPEAVHGAKDAVNADGSINPQQLDYSKIVPLLVGSVQELSAKVTTLQARVALLEAANDNGHHHAHRRHAG